MIPQTFRRNAADWITGVILLAMVYLLVKPDSVAAEFIASFTGAMAALVKAATDMGGGEPGG